jgi:polyhydroxyalkanoate synthesis regulator phasin
VPGVHRRHGAWFQVKVRHGSLVSQGDGKFLIVPLLAWRQDSRYAGAIENGNLIRLIESQSAELAALRTMLEQHVVETRDNFKTLNWKIDRLVEIVDNLNNREHISNHRLSKLEGDVGVLKGDVSALKTDVAAIKAKLSA